MIAEILFKVSSYDQPTNVLNNYGGDATGNWERVPLAEQTKCSE